MSKKFEIRQVITGADTKTWALTRNVDDNPSTEFVDALTNWTEVTVRFEEGFDWKKDDDWNALCKKLRAAAEFNNE